MSKYFEEREAAILRVQETRDMVDALRRNILMLTQTILQVRETSPLYCFMQLMTPLMVLWGVLSQVQQSTQASAEKLSQVDSKTKYSLSLYNKISNILWDPACSQKHLCGSEYCSVCINPRCILHATTNDFVCGDDYDEDMDNDNSDAIYADIDDDIDNNFDDDIDDNADD